MKITHESLLGILTYSPATGGWVWNTCPGYNKSFRDGTPAGSFDGRYRAITIKRKKYLAHRLAWFYMTSEWPKITIDHKNGNTDDNRWDNLREATAAENSRNCAPRKNKINPLKGAFEMRDRYRAKRFFSAICVGGKKHHLGCFFTAEEAHLAYAAAAVKYFGKFARSE